MKKYIYLIATLFLMGGCTLSMEDWVLAEEDRGMDEPYTEHTEFGDITYEFQDSVVNLTENLQDQYLIKVEHDSILYINGDIPGKYRPYVGQKITAGYGYEFPNALMGRVVSVEDVGGILKVTTTAATRDEIFKHLSYDLEYDGIVQNVGLLNQLTDEQLEEVGYQRLEDSTLVNWNTYDSIQAAHGNEKAIARIRKRTKTRGSEKFEDKKDSVAGIVDFSVNIEKSGSYVTLGPILFGGENKISLPDALFELYKGVVFKSSKVSKYKDTFDPQLKVSCKVDQQIHSVAKRDEERKIEMSYTDSRYITTIGVEAGLKYNLIADEEDEPKDYEDFINKVKDYKNVPDKNIINAYKEVNSNINSKKGLEEIKRKSGGKKAIPLPGIKGGFNIPIGPWFCIKFTVGLEPICEICGMGAIEVKITSQWQRAGTITIDESCRKYDEKWGETDWKVTKLMGQLSAEIGYSGRLALAGVFLQTIGAEVGINLKATVSGSIAVDLAGLWDDDRGEIKMDGSGFKAGIEFWADARFFVEPLGWSLWEKNLGEWPNPHAMILDARLGSFKPEVEWQDHAFTVSDNTDGSKELDAYVAMQYKSLGMASIFNVDHPLMRMYQGPIADNKFVYAIPVKSKEDQTAEAVKDGVYATYFAEANKTFHYRFQGTIDKDVTEVHFVPALFKYSKADYMLERDWTYNMQHNLKEGGEVMVDDEYPLEIGDPSITTLQAKQLYAGQCKDASIFNGKGTYVSSKSGKKTAVENMSVDYTKFSDFKFMSQVKIFRAVDMREAYLDVYIYNSAKQKITKNPIRIPLGRPSSGTYTFIFNFTTDWRPTGAGMSTITSGEDDEEVTGVEGEYLFFRVIPYFIHDETGDKVKSSDSKSHRYYTLEYPLKEIKIDDKDKAKWGEVMPEYDLNN